MLYSPACFAFLDGAFLIFLKTAMLLSLRRVRKHEERILWRELMSSAPEKGCSTIRYFNVRATEKLMWHSDDLSLVVNVYRHYSEQLPRVPVSDSLATFAKGQPRNG